MTCGETVTGDYTPEQRVLLMEIIGTYFQKDCHVSGTDLTCKLCDRSVFVPTCDPEGQRMAIVDMVRHLLKDHPDSWTAAIRLIEGVLGRPAR